MSLLFAYALLLKDFILASSYYFKDCFSFDRYTRDNVLASERVGRSYIEAIPDFLKNRPVSFIKHCMTKMDLAETVDQTDIMQMSNNCFKVHTFIGFDILNIKM